ncbi:MAG: N-acetylmuramoyl-L-alanine amidase [Clostridia bacterium]|nr:N-acetylmuramoyl-L-alanine amidase [Clostridia bacterium]
MRKIILLLGIPVFLALLCACGRFSGTVQPITKEVAVQTAETPEEAIAVLPTAPVTMYKNASEAYLCPLESYSWSRKHAPEFIMVHFTSAVVTNREDPYDPAALRALFVENEVSTHYLIRRDGTILCMVPEDRVAWHAGVGEWLGDEKYTNTMNEYAIGIELAAIGSETDMEKYLPAGAYSQLEEAHLGFTDAQYDSLTALVTDLCERYRIPMDGAHVIGHDAYSPEKHDPGELFDWDRLLSADS